MIATVLLTACSGSTPNRLPLNEAFPTVQGKDLKDVPRKVPDEYQGKALIVLVGYVQESQFDIDRWLLGIMDGKLSAEVLELPTIEGLVPGMIAGSIDEGMRSGIPSEEWATVLTLYGEDANKIVAFTGNEKPRNARILLLDQTGVVRWFHDRGYSPRFLLELKDRLASLTSANATGVTPAAAPPP
jgi:hypothetical protein